MLIELVQLYHNGYENQIFLNGKMIYNYFDTISSPMEVNDNGWDDVISASKQDCDESCYFGTDERSYRNRHKAFFKTKEDELLLEIAGHLFLIKGNKASYFEKID